MIEIIPNWHPIFVHFTVGLFSTSVVFYLLSYLISFLKTAFIKIASDIETAGRWCLWAASLSAIMTVLAGLNAFNTVNHDSVSHLAMINHRNWALPTAAAIVLVALWSLWRDCKNKKLTASFIIILLLVQGMLLSTAWRGAELVYRYGLGVMSLPKSEGEGQDHQHGSEMKGSEMMIHSNMPTMEDHDQHNHAN